MDLTNTANRAFLASATAKFRGQKSLTEKAVVQLSDAQLHEPLHRETNSVAVIMKHMAGNMRSRWTNFLTTDGEKPDRHRDTEFLDSYKDREELMNDWESGWACVFKTLDSLGPEDVMHNITIRGEHHTVIDAVIRQIDHYGYHVGQIVQIARILVGDDDWNTLSIARGKSEEFNQRMSK